MNIQQSAFGLLTLAILGCLAVPAPAATTRMIAVGSIDEMQALNGAANPVVQVLSYYPGLNRGGGLFVWNSDGSEAPDECVTFAPRPKQDGAVKGRWMRQLPDALDATMCGAYWDNAHDDASALTRAFAVASARRVSLSLPAPPGSAHP